MSAKKADIGSAGGEPYNPFYRQLGGCLPVPLSPAFGTHRLVNRLHGVRQNPVAAYGIAVGLVAVAILVRWLVAGNVVEGVPFITYYPAIVVATLIAGFWPGVLSVVLSAVTAWYLFLPPGYGWWPVEHVAVSVLLFVAVSGVNIAIVTLLNASVDRSLAQEQNVRVLVESAPNGIVVVDKRGNIRLVNASAEILFGYKRSELLGNNIELLVPDQQAESHRALRESFLQAPEMRMMGVGRDLHGRRKDGSEFPVEIGLNPVQHSGDVAVLATVIDITERKRVQDGQKLIIRELQHRTQNLFAVFQAVAVSSVQAGKTAAEIKYQLRGRIQALASAYAMLADASWEGASLDDILDREFAGFSGRVSVSGCEIVLTPSAAQQFALIVHELGTNALKYGALSNMDGHISIEGRIDRLNGNGTFSFAWKEIGGPSSPTEPMRKGFGSVILLDSARQFAQSVVMDYSSQGLAYSLQLQLSNIEAKTKQYARLSALGLM
jgi:PAS domain S-box-containing protein